MDLKHDNILFIVYKKHKHSYVKLLNKRYFIILRFYNRHSKNKVLSSKCNSLSKAKKEMLDVI
jgi:hypothetical protein